MLFYGAVRTAARRAAGQRGGKPVPPPGPPLWRLLLEELADWVDAQRKRLRRLFRRDGKE